jgi:hypothetical protein
LGDLRENRICCRRQELYSANRLLNGYKDKPSARCLPELAGFLARWPLKIVQTPNLLVTLRSDDVISAHQVYLDGRSFLKDLESS